MPAALPWIPPSTPTLIAFLAIIAAVVLAFVGAVALSSTPPQRLRNTGLAAAGVAFWMALHALLAGQLEALLPFILPVYLLGTNGTAVVLALSPVGRLLARGVPLAALVAFPLFRVPLEVVLHLWAEQGVIPVAMSWSGQNLDVIAGIVGPSAALLMVLWPARARAVAWVGNTVCFLFLLNVARVAVLASPGPQHSFDGPPLVLALHAPEIWIVSICVAGALFGHVVTYRALATT